MQRAINGFLPDGTILNGVANFYRTSKPLTRLDGSRLVTGDIWYNPTTQTEGFWDGTDWVTRLLLADLPRLIVAVAGSNSSIQVSVPFPSGTVIKIKDFVVSFANISGTPASNFVSIFLITRNDITSFSPTDISSAISANTALGLSTVAVNTSVTLGVGAGQAAGFGARSAITGAPSNCTFQMGFTYVAVL